MPIKSIKWFITVALFAGFQVCYANGDIQYYFLTLPAEAFACKVGSLTITPNDMSIAKRKAMLEFFERNQDSVLELTDSFPLFKIGEIGSNSMSISEFGTADDNRILLRYWEAPDGRVTIALIILRGDECASRSILRLYDYKKGDKYLQIDPFSKLSISNFVTSKDLKAAGVSPKLIPHPLHNFDENNNISFDIYFNFMSCYDDTILEDKKYGDELPFKNLRHTKFYPVFLHWKNAHFVVIRKKPED
jgi:hypothetical protein